MESSPPIQLLRPSADHSRLEICEEAVSMLQKIENPLVVLTIVGTQRTGKSTLLNLLHSRRTDGFGVGHFMEPKTHGLWFRLRRHPRDENVLLLLLDTEGLDSPNVPMSYNWTLSAVALLLSNFFIYQTKGSIESSAIDRLLATLAITEHVRGTQSTKVQNFLWVLRDQALLIKSGKQYCGFFLIFFFFGSHSQGGDDSENGRRFCNFTAMFCQFRLLDTSSNL